MAETVVLHAANLATPGDLIEGALAIDAGKIAYVGPSEALPHAFATAPRRDLGGRLVTPGLIDCHTHLVHAGSRAKEFALRLAGASYGEIARAGGGIAATVAATRAASEEALIESALARLDLMLAQGVTCVEVKSGYGLDRETELRMLRVARALPLRRPVRVRTSFLGAHAIPKGTTADNYLDEVCIPTLRAAAAEGLVDAVDAYCETIAFSSAQVTRLFEVAHELDLPVKLHAEQLSNQAGAALAARHAALSADHLEHLDAGGIAAMAASGTVAVLLPGAFHQLRETRKPPVAGLRAAGVPMAVATDCNPGTSPMTSLPLAMNMAAVLFGLTGEECLAAATTNAARALGLEDCGALASGLRADLAVWDFADPAELSYRIGEAPLFARYFEGRPC
jgi:imidazolonepropionase